MKKLFVIMIAAAALFSACEKKLTEIDVPAAVSEGRTITVNALETKTAISPKGNGYSFTWNRYDAIRLYEIVYENNGSSEANATDCDWFTSDGLSSDVQQASFTVNLNTSLSNPNGGKYRYIGTYPADCDYYTDWVNGHPVFSTEFPYRQNPTATSFDPLADLMVSSPKVLNDRAESGSPLSLNFARVGAIVKLTLTGLAAGEKVETGYLQFGNSFKVVGNVEYDPELGRVDFLPGMETFVGKDSWESDYRFGFVSTSTVEFNPVDLYAGSDGKADIWLRLPEGTVTDSFTVRVWTRENGTGDWHGFGKSVNLAALGKSLKFNNGALTAFSVATVDMPDPYIKLSYTYTDGNGDEQTAVSESGNINVGEYGSYLSPAGGSVVLNVETNQDPFDIVIDNYASWANCSFDPATMKLTITYDPCSVYSNYMVSTREGIIYIRLSSNDAVYVQVYVNQLKPYFNASGTRKVLLPWLGGTVTGEVKTNHEPVVECPSEYQSAVNWAFEKTDTGYNVTFTLIPNETNSLSVIPIVIKDPISPSTKYLNVNLLRYPMIADGDYYILTRNTHSGTPYRWYAAGSNLPDNQNAMGCTIAFGDGNALDFDNTDYLTRFTFERMENSTDYRIYCKKGDVKYYLSLGNTRTSNMNGAVTVYIELHQGSPKMDGSADLSRWEVLSRGKDVAILNHVYANLDEHTNSWGLHIDLDNTQVYLARPSYVQMTDNQGSYGSSYFVQTYSYFMNTGLSYELKLYDLAADTYLPLAY